MNDTLGPEGLVPSALVFGEFPKAYSLSEILGVRSSVEEREKIAASAGREMEKRIAKMKLKRAL